SLRPERCVLRELSLGDRHRRSHGSVSGTVGLGNRARLTTGGAGASDQSDARLRCDCGMEEVKAYYAGFAEREWARLDNPADGQLEFAVTCDVLARHLPVGARGLDLGGGPARYALGIAQHESG